MDIFYRANYDIFRRSLIIILFIPKTNSDIRSTLPETPTNWYRQSQEVMGHGLRSLAKPFATLPISHKKVDSDAQLLTNHDTSTTRMSLLISNAILKKYFAGQIFNDYHQKK